MARRLGSAGPVIAASAVAFAVAVAAQPAAADVILNPNQIVGEVAFTNTNPAVLSILRLSSDAPPGQGFGIRGASHWARSLPPQSPQLSTNAITAPGSSGIRLAYTATVESGPPGLGIAYTVDASTPTGNGQPGTYRFAPLDSAPVEREPAADVRLDFRECAGLVHVTFRDPLGQPVPVEGGSVTALRETAPGSGTFESLGQGTATFERGDVEIYAAARGDGTLYRVRVSIQLGTDPELDLLRYEHVVEVTIGCDEIVEIPVVLDPGTGGTLGTVTGNFDVLREDEHHIGRLSLLTLSSGPWNNSREQVLRRTPSSGPYLLPNVMPSTVVTPADDYSLSAVSCFRTGRQFATLFLPILRGILVPSGSSLDVGDTFIADPGYLQTDVYLRAAVVRYPAQGSPLARIVFDPDGNSDGIPDRMANQIDLQDSRLFAYGRNEIAPGATDDASTARAACQFETRIDPGTGSVSGEGELVLGNLRREPSYWEGDGLSLNLRKTTTPSVPESYIGQSSTISSRNRKHLVQPGATTRTAHRYCFNDLYLRFHATSGTLERPQINADGSFVGVDFEGSTVDYRVYPVYANGTPTNGNPAPNGLVVMSVPTGSYVLSPEVWVGNSRVFLAPFDKELGCGESYDEWLDLRIGLDARPACVADPTLAISGSITGGATVSSIEYRVNGSPLTTVCNACGVDPTFGFVASLVPGSNTVEVVATESGGRKSSALFAVERAAPVPDFGNVLMAVESGLDVRFSWQRPGSAAASELHRDVIKPFPAPVLLASVPQPGESWDDVGVLPPSAGPLLFYRVRGRNCAGVEGP